MLTPGHIAISYLIIKGFQHFGLPVTQNEILQTIVAGNVMDIDFLVGQFTQKTGEAHHQNISHTPLGAIIIFVVLILLFHPPITIAFILLISLIAHLVLDDVGYWMYKFKLYNTPTNPQINWLYPVTPYHKNKLITGNKNVLLFYLIKAWPVAIFELLITITAVFVFFSIK